MILILIIIAIIIIYLVIKPYFIKYDTICGYTGGLGSGKSFMSDITARVLYRKSKIVTKTYNLFHRDKLEIPKLYSSIPIRLNTFGKPKYSEKLTPDMLTLQTRVIPGSVALLDEVDVFANQYSYANPNIIEQHTKKEFESGEIIDSGLFDEQIRLWRHLNSSPCVESKMVVNTQCTSNIVTIIRRRINTIFVLDTFRPHYLRLVRRLTGITIGFYTVHCRKLSLSDEIVNVSSNDLLKDTYLTFGLMPLKSHYDTHCYSNRANSIPIAINDEYSSKKTNVLTKCPYKKLENKSTKED